MESRQEQEPAKPIYSTMYLLGRENAEKMGKFNIQKDEDGYKNYIDHIYFCHGYAFNNKEQKDKALFKLPNHMQVYQYAKMDWKLYVSDA